jgi:hypothetical protein
MHYRVMHSLESCKLISNVFERTGPRDVPAYTSSSVRLLISSKFNEPGPWRYVRFVRQAVLAACTACGARWHLAAGCHPAFAGLHPPWWREAPCGQPGLAATRCAARKLSAVSFQLSARGRSPFRPAWRALGQNRRGAQRFSGLVIQQHRGPTQFPRPSNLLGRLQGFGDWDWW